MKHAASHIIRVLLIEDADMDALLIERLIRNPMCDMFTVDRVDCLAAATELMLTENFDVALLDLDLPDGDGIDSLHRLRAVDARLPIVILTGHQDENLGLQAVEVGAQDFLCKSGISGKALFRVLRYAVARHRKMLGYAAEAQTDFLTGLPNRRQFDKHFRKMVAENNHLFFAMIDVDHFKRVNDTYGHAYGDHVLRKLAEIMQKELKSLAHVARIGGEEFAVLIPVADQLTAFQALDYLRMQIESFPWEYESKPVDVTISIGLTAVDLSKSWTEASSIADVALYQAKRNGRNQVCYSGSDDPKSGSVLEIGVTSLQSNTNNPVTA